MQTHHYISHSTDVCFPWTVVTAFTFTVLIYTFYENTIPVNAFSRRNISYNEISEFAEHHAEFWNRKTWISILALPFTSYEALGKLIPPSRKH